MAKQVHSFEQLPLRAGDPPYSAWGLWDKPELGALNYLSDENTLKVAKEEIQTGVRIGLKYVSNHGISLTNVDYTNQLNFALSLPLDLIDPPLLGRRGFERHIVNKAPRVINDDVVSYKNRVSFFA
jgi:hypothetical protein